MTASKCHCATSVTVDRATAQASAQNRQTPEHYDNIRMPAEWEEQDAVLLAWPNPHGDWGPILAEIEAVIVKIIRNVSVSEQIVIAAPEPQHTRSVLKQHGIKMDNIHLYQINNNDTWARDFGPIGVKSDSSLFLYDFGFNGWGLKYPSNFDNQINRNLAAKGVWQVPLRTQDLILEGEH